MSEEERLPRWLAAAIDALAQLGATGAGLTIGGPPGALAGAAGAPLLSRTVQEGLQVVQHRWFSQIGEAVEVGADTAQLGQEELVRRLVSTPAGGELFWQALQGAAHAGLKAKVKALGRSLATGALADEKVDHELLFVRAMADIELPHLRLIQHMKDAEERLTRTELVSLSGIGSGLDPLLSTLERHGLVREEPPGRWGAVLEKDQEPDGTWAPTAFGLECLQRLRDAGYSDPDSL